MHKVLKDEPQNIKFNYMMGEVKNSLGKKEEALVYYKKIVDLDNINKGKILKKILSIEKEMFKKDETTEKDYDDKNAVDSLKKIVVYMRAYKYNDVICECQELIKLNLYTEEANEYMNAAKLFLEINRNVVEENYEEAYDCYQKIVNNKRLIKATTKGLKKLKPVIDKIKIILEKQSNLVSKMEPTKVNEKLNEETVDDLIKKADTYLKSGLYDKALSYYKKLLETESGKLNSIFGIVAIRIKKNELNGIENFVESYKDYLTVDQYYRINNYIQIKKDIESKIENHKKVLEHIVNKHQVDFYEDISELYFQILDTVSDTEIINGYSFSYIIECDKIIGVRNKNQVETNYIQVVSFLEKTNIITMYPVQEGKRTEDAIKLEVKTKKIIK